MAKGGKNFKERELEKIMTRISIHDLWHSDNEDEWKSELKVYKTIIPAKAQPLNEEMSKITVETIKSMSPEEWFNFLLEKYYRWKFSSARLYKFQIRWLKKYKEEHKLKELYEIKNKIVAIDKHETERLLKATSDIKGLNTAGASGLLSLLYPDHFGTVDQFVVKALWEIKSAPELKGVHDIKPEDITTSEGVSLIKIMQKKAEDLNKLFKTNLWTPRKIDMVLWTYRSEDLS